MTRILPRALLVAALAAPLAAQSPSLTVGAPRDAGMSDSVLQQGVALYRSAVDSGHLVGAVLLVARNGTVVLHEAIGLRNRAGGLPMEKATMFRMASNTKPIVATAAAILAERGQLRFTDSVFRYIASFDNDESRAITIGQLLSHTSGFRINTLFLQPMMKQSRRHPDAPNLQLEAARFGDVGPKVKPGTTYAYSNPGFNTLGAVIEIASGMPLDVFLRDEIYAKLDMRDTYNHEVGEKLDGKLPRMGAVYYARDKKSGEWIAAWSPGDRPQVPFVRASGGLISTAWDYAMFLQMFLNGGTYGDTRIIPPQSVATLTTRHTPLGGPSYGYGWAVDSTGVYSHSGSDGTFAWVDPARGVIGMVLTQTPNGRNPRARFMELVRHAVETGGLVNDSGTRRIQSP